MLLLLLLLLLAGFSHFGSTMRDNLYVNPLYTKVISKMFLFHSVAHVSRTFVSLCLFIIVFLLGCVFCFSCNFLFSCLSGRRFITLPTLIYVSLPTLNFSPSDSSDYRLPRLRSTGCVSVRLRRREQRCNNLNASFRRSRTGRTVLLGLRGQFAFVIFFYLFSPFFHSIVFRPSANINFWQSDVKFDFHGTES